MAKHVAIYVRVSTRAQDTKSQEPELTRWAKSQDEPVVWYRDSFSGKTLDRPGWNRLEAEIRAGKVSKLIIWRIDRLGRTASGLTGLFDDLQRRSVNLISLKDGLDLSTPAGRLMANVLASVAQFETEVRGERVAAGQAVAKEKGIKWGGSKPGIRKKVNTETADLIHHMREQSSTISKIASVLKLSRPTIYSVLSENTSQILDSFSNSH